VDASVIAPAQKHSLRSLLELAWPIVLARATQSVIGFGDALMVAPLGEDALAAVTTGSLNVFAFIILPMGTAFILQSFAAQLRGRGDLGGIQRYAYYGLILGLIAGLFTLPFLPFVHPALRLLGLSENVTAMMASYITIRMLSVAPAVGLEALGNWYGGLGNTRPALVGSVISMLLDVFFNYALIEPRFGLPGYGVEGAAWGSTVSSWVGCGVVAVMFFSGKGYDRVREPLRLRMSELRRVVRFGLPNGVNWFLEFAAFIMFINVVVGHLGTTTLAAFNVVMNINSVSFMPAFGLASAGAIMAGEAIGRRAHHEVSSIVLLTAKVTAAWMGAIGLIYFLLPEQILGWFGSDNGSSLELLQVGAVMLGMSAIWQLFDAISMTLSEALRSAGDTTWCMGARLVLAWLVFTPISWTAVLMFDGGVMTVMSALIAYLALLAAAFIWRFTSGKWRDIDLVGEPSVL
jgi:MATE family multidrug resistance protein